MNPGSNPLFFFRTANGRSSIAAHLRLSGGCVDSSVETGGAELVGGEDVAGEGRDIVEGEMEEGLT
jgi:hypothetical protein